MNSDLKVNAKRDRDNRWKKQFARIQQIASQGLGRVQGTSVLNDVLQELDGRLEDVKLFCQNVSKKLLVCLSGNPGADYDKRLRKLPLHSFSTCLTELKPQAESRPQLFVNLSRTSAKCAEVEDQLSRTQIDFECDVETKFLQPLQGIVERDIPALVKLRKQLTNLTLDMDAAKSRLKRQPDKAEDAVLRDEAEEAEMKVDQCRDQFAAELFSFAAREEEFCQIFLSLLKAQADLHRKSLKILESVVPQVAEEIELNTVHPVFGTSLKSHLKHMKGDIAMVIEVCVDALYQNGIEEEGLFRLAAGASRVKKLKAAFDCEFYTPEDLQDPHCVADVLKQYLRNLPEPLMTFELFEEWMSVSQKPPDLRCEEIRRILDKMPKEHYNNLRYLMKFLSKVAEKSDINKMSASNLSIVFGPNLIWPPGDRSSNFQIGSSSVELLISHADYFFPEDIDFSNGSSSADSSPAAARHNRMLPKSDSHTNVNLPAYATLPLPHRSHGNGNNVVPSLSDPATDDLSSAGTKRPYRKAPAPAPPNAYRPAPMSPPPTATTAPSTATGHKRSVSVDLPNQGRVGAVERPNIPPPAPPKKPEVPPKKRESEDVTKHPSSENSENLITVNNQEQCANSGSGDTLKKGSEKMSKSADNLDVDSRLGENDHDEVSSLADCSSHEGNSQSESSSGTSTEDIRKNNAALRAQWWQSPLPGVDSCGKIDIRKDMKEEHHEVTVGQANDINSAAEDGEKHPKVGELCTSQSGNNDLSNRQHSNGPVCSITEDAGTREQRHSDLSDNGHEPLGRRIAVVTPTPVTRAAVTPHRMAPPTPTRPVRASPLKADGELESSTSSSTPRHSETEPPHSEASSKHSDGITKNVEKSPRDHKSLSPIDIPENASSVASTKPPITSPAAKPPRPPVPFPRPASRFPSNELEDKSKTPESEGGDNNSDDDETTRL